jgi:hypothetical protein
MVNADSGAMPNTFCAGPGIGVHDRRNVFHRGAGTALDRKHGDLLLFETWEIRFANKETVHA